MSYATVQDMIDRWGEREMTQLALTGTGDLDNTLVQAALDEARDLIREHVAGRAAPDAESSLTLRRVQLTIARWILFRDGAPERVQQLYEDAMRLLRDIAAGRVQLGAQHAGSATEDTVAMQSGEPVRWGRGNGGFI
jgi:phage gp36-like protein